MPFHHKPPSQRHKEGGRAMINLTKAEALRVALALTKLLTRDISYLLMPAGLTRTEECLLIKIYEKYPDIKERVEGK